MLIKLNETETVTVCMNHKDIKETEYYTIKRFGDELGFRKFDKSPEIKSTKKCYVCKKLDDDSHDSRKLKYKITNRMIDSRFYVCSEECLEKFTK